MEYLYLMDLHRLFRINLLDFQRSKPDSHPVMECVLNFENLCVPIGMGLFTLNSKTYFLGGLFLRGDINSRGSHIPSLYEFNLNVFKIHKRGLGRSPIPPTFGPKTNPKVVQHGGKVYVLSTCPNFCRVPDLPSPTFEVYDPLRNRWESLPDPPPYECRGKKSYVDRYMVRSFHASGNYIIMLHDIGLWLFNVNTKTWINGESIMRGFRGMPYPLHGEGAVAYFRRVMIAYGGYLQGLVAYFFEDPSCAIVKKKEVLTKLNRVFNPSQAYHGSVFYWGRGVMCFAYSDKSDFLGVLIFRVIFNEPYSLFVECMNHRIYPATPLHWFDNLCPAFLTGEHLLKDMVNARVVCENIESFNVIPTDELAITFDAYRNELEKSVLPSPHLMRNIYQAHHFGRLYRFPKCEYAREDDFEGFGHIPSDVIFAEGIKLIPTNETKASEDDAAMRLDVALLDPHSADEALCAETPFCENLIPDFYSTLSDRGVIILQAELEPMPAVFILDSTEMERASLSGSDSCRFVRREHMDTLGALMFIPRASRMRPADICYHSNYIPDHSKFEIRNSLTGDIVKRRVIKCSSGLDLKFKNAPGLCMFVWPADVWTIK